MFNRQTVFILGAGASWHYGYPTGEMLVKKMIGKAKQLETFLDFSANTANVLKPQYLADVLPTGGTTSDQWRAALAECKALRTGLEQVNPLVIDYYLGWNPHLARMGRLLIAWVILECEADPHLNGNPNRPGHKFDKKDDWCRFIVHQLAMNCTKSADLLKNTVSFVTFNYDVSLDTILFQHLSHIKLFEEKDIKLFLGGSRINHVYGKVPPVVAPRKINWQMPMTPPGGTPDHLSDMMNFLNEIYSASEGLKVIDPHDKTSNDESFAIARAAIAAADCVYILGYGFDANNSERLNLPTNLRYDQNRRRSVFFTNFGDSNRVNKRASLVFFGNTVHFNRDYEGTVMIPSYERSTRDVYEALELDFESFD